MAFGVMGDYQPQGQVHVLTAMLDFGLDIQAALDQPRVHASPKTGGVQAEAGLSPLLRQGLLTGATGWKSSRNRSEAVKASGCTRTAAFVGRFRSAQGRRQAAGL